MIITTDEFLDVDAWVMGVQTFLVNALDRRVDVTGLLLPTRLVIKIRVPHGEKIIALNHAIDSVMLRRISIDHQAMLTQQAGMILKKLEDALSLVSL